MSRGTINEQYLDDIAVAINAKLGSSSTMTPSEMALKINSIPTSSGAILGHGSFSANGSYRALDDNLDGYSTVDVSIPMAILSASNNGTYTPSVGGYNQVNVNVPLESITISVNGSYSTAQGGYNDITVDVFQPTMSTLSVNVNGSYTAPSGYAYDQVDVDVPQATMSTLSVNANGSYTADPNTGFDIVNVDVPSAALSSKTITVNGIYNAIDDDLDGYSSISVSVPGGAVLGSKTITENGVYNAIDDSLDGYDTVAISVKSDVGTYDWYSDGVDVTVTVDDVNSGTGSFYDTYKNQHINTLTINAGTSTHLKTNFNQESSNRVYFKKLVLGSGVVSAANFTGPEYDSMREFEIQSLTSFSGTYCRSQTELVKISYSPSLNITFTSSYFSDCRRLETLTLPTTITSTPYNFCAGCFSLEEVNLSELKNLTTIGSATFYNCYNIKNIDFSELSNLTTISANAFNNCYKVKDIDFSTLSNLTEIGNQAFCNTGVSELNTSFLTSIGTGAFTECNDLITVSIPNANNLGTGIFGNCENLISITLSPTLSSIPSYLLSYCSNLQNIDLSNLSICTTIGSSAFYGCPKLSEVILPSNITTLESGCFQGDFGLSSINLDNIQAIGSSCFYMCSSLSSVNLPNVTSIGADAFERSGVITVTLNPSLSSLPSYCFWSCSSLTSINLENISTLGNSCFTSCNALTSITLNSALTSIPVCCFSATHLNSVEIPPSVSVVASSAFNTSTLKTLTIYDTTIITTSGNAFSNNITDIYYRGAQGKTVSDLETEYNTRYGSNSYLKPTTHSVHYIPYEDWHTE